MPNLHFFKLAQDLKQNPQRLIKRLAADGITIQSASTMIDDDTVARVRVIVAADNAAAAAAAAAEPPTPPAEATPVATVPEVAPPAAPKPEVAPVAPPAKPQVPAAPRPAAAPAAPANAPAARPPVRKPTDKRPPIEGRPAAGEKRPVQNAGGQPLKAKRVPRPNLLTPENDGGLSPDAEFGIVKVAGIVPMPAVPRPRPAPQQQRPGGPGPGGPGGAPQGGPGQRPPFRNNNAPFRPAPSGAPTGLNGPATPPAAPGDAKTVRKVGDKAKVKRTVFTEKEKKAGGLKTRGSFIATPVRGGRRKHRGPKEPEVFVVEQPVIITGNMTVGDIAERIHVPPAQIISQLIGMGVFATVNQQIVPEQIVEVLEKLEFEALYEAELAEVASWRLTAGGAEVEMKGEKRPPVVTILGHVDHGKTTLLDSIRKTHVTEQEFGGITQHIGAYQVKVRGEKITFLDTPGHAAFTAMRARGANLTDIAVLVVAADDGIQPQTIEAIDHAKAAKVPIIVAINKIDAPGAQPEAVKAELSGHGLVSEAYGGTTIMVEVSAKKGTNIEQLLEMILLVAEVAELKAVADKPATGAVVESKLDKQRGPVATILVQEGTLHVGDSLVIGMVSGKVRAMNDDKGKPIKEAGPSTPVEITGINSVPVAGDLFEVVSDEKKAREIAGDRQLKAREERLQAHVSLQDLSNMVASGQVKDLNIIVKSDVAGSIEAISQAIGQVTHKELRVNIIHAGVGDVTESDVLLASASNAIIVGFHVHMETQGRAIAEEAGIDVRIYEVIYDLVDDIEKAMIGMLKPIFEEQILGHAEVRLVFRISRLGSIAGSYVKDGLIRRGSKVRVIRNGETVLTANLDSLKHLKEDVREMAQGYECGIAIDNYNNWEEGDIVESFIVKELRRETL